MSSWDGVKRRADDKGEESPAVILARIDERVYNFTKKLDEHLSSYNIFRAENKKDIDWLNKIVYIGFGAVGVLEIIFRLNGK